MTLQKNRRVAPPGRPANSAQPRRVAAAQVDERGHPPPSRRRCQRGANKSKTRCRRAARDSGQRRWPLLYRILAQLRQLLPPRHPVDVLTNRKFKTFYGDCTRIGRRFRIRLSRSLDEPAAIETLIHEWAHALSWERSPQESRKMARLPSLERERVAHGPQWGIAYSLVYRVLVTEIMPAIKAENARLRAARRSQYRQPTRTAAMARR